MSQTNSPTPLARLAPRFPVACAAGSKQLQERQGQLRAAANREEASRSIWNVPHAPAYFFRVFRRTLWYKYVVTMGQYGDATPKVFPFVRMALWYQLLVIWKTQDGPTQANEEVPSSLQPPWGRGGGGGGC